MIPILSIVIPTHNRASYAISAIESILYFENEPIELIVTDTSENDDLEFFVSSLTESRLRYIHIKEALSMTENYNLAMSMATGDYVCLIGDDDTITYDAIITAKWAKKNHIEIVSPLVVANYAWPDFKHRFLGMSHAGNLYIKKEFGSYSFKDSKKGLDIALTKSILGTEGLPKVYHSIVDRQLMEKIKNLSGSYFHGVSPDVSGAVGLALVSENYLEIDYPITIPGAAGNSNSGRSAMNKHKGTLEDDSHTKRFKNLNWPKLIPQFTSVETVWAQAAYSTLEAFGKKDLIEKYNFINLYAICNLKHNDHKKDIEEVIKIYKESKKISNYEFLKIFTFSSIFEVLALLFRYGKRILIPTASGGKYFISGIKNIFVAQKELKIFMLNHNSHKQIEEILINIK
ncbi:glycosyl transferase family 2 [Malaciobacter marinus]|jgi:glycosyltransferase involved in cell wall biosynthesis|uniref:Glycosyl transferase family 2 n=1 Tax=Malaciobacter marinus TaxID=505249 RepID=A0AB36ZVP8_9BACT|nr:glycosyltransferase family 2 protein [Malaciobacter marinus]PPK59395.1 glycosyl transferase family 2 [Malaciobacter marinus]